MAKGKSGSSKGTKRVKKVLSGNLRGVTKGSLRRPARRSGVKRISGLVYEEARGVLKGFGERVVRDSVAYTEHARRRTVSAGDVVNALRKSGRAIYGY